MGMTVTKTPSEFGMVKSPMAFGLNSDTANLDKFLLEVWIEKVFGSGTFTFAFMAELRPDETGDALLRIEERLKWFLKFSLPDVNDVAVQATTGTLLKYKIKYAEKITTELEFVGDYYHEDISGGGPDYLKTLLMDEEVGSGVKYLVESETTDDGLLTFLQFIDGANTKLLGTVTTKAFNSYQENAAVLPQNYDSIRIPAFVKVNVYKTPVVYSESAVLYAWLAGESKRRIIPQLVAPTIVAVTAETSSSLSAAATSGSYKQELGYEWQISASYDFSVVLETKNTTTAVHEVEFDSLDPSQLYYIRVRERGSTPSAWSAVDSVTTLALEAPNALVLTPALESVGVSWTSNSGGTEDGFELEASQNGESNWGLVAAVGTGITVAEETGLLQNIERYYRVKATLASGDSAYSPMVMTTTLGLGVPSDLVLTPALDSVGVAWASNSAGVEDGFVVERSHNGTSNWIEVGTVGTGVLTINDPGRDPNSPYYYRVKATLASGDSAWSGVESTTTLPVPAPSALVLTPSIGSVQIDWTSNSAGVEEGFRVERSLDGSTGWIGVGTVGSGILTIEDTGRTPDTDYYYQVKATHSKGDSAYSSVVSTTTLILAAPSGLLLTPSNGAIQLDWTSNSGGDEEGFNIERSFDGSTGWLEVAEVASGILTFNHQGLDPTTEYYYQIKARHVSGGSNYSNIASATTSVMPAPSLVVLTPSAFTMKVDWTFDSYFVEEGFTIERSLNGTTGWSVVGTVGFSIRTFTDTILDSSTTYHYRVKATHTASDSAYSSVANDTTLSFAAPSALLFTPSLDGIIIDWTSNTGGDELGFAIETSPDGINNWTPYTNVLSGITTYNDTPLLNSTDRHYRIKADSAEGSSPYSSVGSTATLPFLAPTDLVFTPTLESIQIDWVVNEWGVVQSYDIERSLDGSTGWTNIGNANPATPTFTDTSLTPGTTYYYRVIAVHPSGNQSITEATATLALAAPSNVILTPGAGSLQIDWTSNTGGEESGFGVERSLNGSDWDFVIITATGVTTYNDTGLSSATNYYYRILATHSSGVSDYSTAVNETTL